MKWQGLALLGLLLGSCGIDGGSSGTGITTTEGNVAAVTAVAATAHASAGMGLSAAASTNLAGIRVSLEGTELHDVTGASGSFRLAGSYDSVVTVRFARASDGLDARLAINVPAGGTLTLADVALDVATDTASPESQSVFFPGTITEVDCPAGELHLVSRQRPDDGDDYLVRLAGSSIVDANGMPVACDRLAAGQDATVSGTVNPDGSFGDATVTLG